MTSFIQIPNVSADKKADIVERYLDAKSRWDFTCLALGSAVFIAYVTPLSGVVQKTWQAGVGVAKITGLVAEVEKTATLNYWAPDLQRTPKKGEKIAGWLVTSGYGPRSTGIKGASTNHRGIDIGTPIGIPVYAIGKSGEKVNVRCWKDGKGGGLVASYKSSVGAFDYLHLSKCAAGSQQAGSIIAASGNSGIGAPHLHFQRADKSPPATGEIYWALTGRQPQPLVERGKKK